MRGEYDSLEGLLTRRKGRSSECEGRKIKEKVKSLNDIMLSQEILREQ
jgi:hypothetical protein